MIFIWTLSCTYAHCWWLSWDRPQLIPLLDVRVVVTRFVMTVHDGNEICYDACLSHTTWSRHSIYDTTYDMRYTIYTTKNVAITVTILCNSARYDTIHTTIWYTAKIHDDDTNACLGRFRSAIRYWGLYVIHLYVMHFCNTFTATPLARADDLPTNMFLVCSVATLVECYVFYPH